MADDELVLVEVALCLSPAFVALGPTRLARAVEAALSGRMPRRKLRKLLDQALLSSALE